MTDPVTLIVAFLALCTAGLAGWFLRPRPPVLDGERWFKVQLATLLRGEVEAGGGTAEIWEREVVRFVPYHPAGRLLERKVVAPWGYRPPGPALDGELGLVEALARLPNVRARIARVFDQDEDALEARLGDPADLGPDYDPSTHVGPGADWEALARWGGGDPTFRERLLERVEARWVLVRGAPSDAPDVLSAMAAELGPLAVEFPWSGEALPEGADRLGRRLAEVLGGTSDRVVLVGAGEGAHLALRALAADPGLRDRTLAVLSIGGLLLREGDIADWTAYWFAHERLDTEARRLTPYAAVQWLDRDRDPLGAYGLDLAAQRFPEPADDGEWIEPVDLGPLPADPELPVGQVARALVAVIGGLVLSRR